LLSLISISLVVASGDGDEAENVEAVNDNYDDGESEDDNTAAVDETLTDAPADDNDNEEPSEGIVVKEVVDEEQEEEEKTNEDTVDVENVAVGKQAGKYMNYDDYQLSSLDESDSNYNWNGELKCLKKRENSFYRLNFGLKFQTVFNVFWEFK
jgi:hypothetical protein